MAAKSVPATANKSNDELTKLVADLRQEMQTIREDLGALAGVAGDAAKSELSALKKATPERARALLHKAETTAAAVADKTKKQFAAAEETVEAQVTEHPWRTLGIVGLAGFALGLLVRR